MDQTSEKKKKVLVDLYHLPQYNFFKNAILSFQPSEIDIYCVNRGKLRQVIQYELPEYKLLCIGDYKKNKGMLSMIFRIIIPRMYQLYKVMKPGEYRFVITAHYQANFVAKLRGIPNVAFIDDPRRFVFPLLKWSADRVFVPPFKSEIKGVSVFNALKEWSYLSPQYFKPDQTSLSEYNLEPKSYLFIREVSTDTSNYLAQSQGAILSVSSLFPKGTKVVLSLENKMDSAYYPKDWIILKEPVKHIHSLMYFSKIVISSGDSVAREGAMLGVPALYAGIRDMPANDIMISKGMLSKIHPDKLVAAIVNMINNEGAYTEQETFRNQLYQEWDDVTNRILDQVSEK